MLPPSTWKVESVAAKKARPAKGQPYHHGDLRRALLDAAVEMLGDSSTSEVTLREVARRAGVTHAAPYRHFADKNALLAAVAEEGFRSMHALMQERMASHAPGTLARLKANRVAYVLYAVHHPAHFRVMFGPGLFCDPATAQPGDPPQYPALAEAGQATFGALQTTLAECQSAGVLRPGDLQLMALTAWSLVHGLAMLFVDGQLAMMHLGPPEAERIADQVTQVLDRGFA